MNISIVAYLTFLREVLDRKSDIVLYNAPVRNLRWFNKSEWGIRFERLEQEFVRIERYSQLGHLATYREAINYQKERNCNRTGERTIWLSFYRLG